MKIYFTYIVLFLLTVFNCANAQDKQNSIEFTPFYGLSMFSGQNNTLKGNFGGAELIYHINMGNNTADWVRMFGVKGISVSASYRQFQGVTVAQIPNSEGILGNAFGLVSRVDISLFNIGGTDVIFSPGMGVAYSTQTYDTDNNPLAGSHINFAAQAALRIYTPLSTSTRLVTGLDLYHYSNVAFKLLNGGVNTINASIGIDHDIDKAGPGTSKTADKYATYSKHSIEFTANIGRRGLFQTDQGLTAPDIAYQRTATSKLYKSGFYLGYTYRLSHLIGLKLGSDAVYYYTTLDTIQDVHHFYATFQELASSYDSWRVGLTGGADIFMGRTVFGLNAGEYLHFNSYQGLKGFHPNPPNWYWNFNVDYYLSPSFAIEAKEYFHRTQPDYIGFGFLYRLKLGD